MTNTTVPPTGTPPLSPAQLLEAQVRLLTEIKAAHELEFGQLRQQNEQLQHMVKALTEQRSGPAVKLSHVKVEDFNMPFLALVGFVLKASLASIPAAIIFSAVWMIFAVILSASLGLGLGR